MKTKLLAFALSVCLAFCVLCSCGVAENTTETTGTTSTNDITDHDPDAISADSIDEFIETIKTSKAAPAKAIRSEGTFYYPVPVCEGYELTSVVSMLHSVHDYTVTFSFTATDDTQIYGEYIEVITFYEINDKLSYQDAALSRMDSLKKKYTKLADGNVYSKKDYELYFLYGDHVHLLPVDKNYIDSTYIDKNFMDDLSWQDFIEMKSIDVKK